MKVRDIAVYLAIGVLLLSMVASFAMVASAAPGTTTSTPAGTSTTTSTPTDTPTTTTSSGDYSVDQIVQWAQSGRDISAERAVEVQQYFISHQSEFDKQDIRLVSSWLQDQLPTDTPTGTSTTTSTPTNGTATPSGDTEQSKYGVSDVLKEDKPSNIYASVPGSNTVVTDVEFRPDGEYVLLTIHTEVSREVLVVTDLSDVRSGDGGSFVVTQRRYVLDDDQGGHTFQIRVPADTGRKGTQAIGLSFRSGSNPIGIASESPEIWERPASHWMAGFGILLGGGIVSAAIYYGRDKYDPFEREF